MWKFYIYLLLLLSLFTLSDNAYVQLRAEETPETYNSASLKPDTLSAIREEVNSDPKKALRVSHDILGQYTSSLSQQEKIELMSIQSGANERLGNFKTGLEIGEKALSRARELIVDSHVMADLYKVVGRNLEGLGQIPQAMRAYQNAHENYKAAGDRRGMASSKLNFAGLYNGAKLYSKAITAYEQALALLNPKDDRFLYTRTLNNLGFTYIGNGQPKKAIEYLEQARDLAIKMGNEMVIAYTYENSGEAFYHDSQYDKAKKYLHLALKIAQTNGIEPLTTAIYHYLGLVEFAQKNYAKSEEYANKALKIAQKNNDVAKLASIYDLLSIQARHQKNYKNALTYRDLNLLYEKNITSDDIVVALSLLQTEFQQKERKQQISLLKRDNEIQRLSLQEEKNLRYIGFALVTILCLSVGFLLYTLRVKSQATSLAIAREKDLLESKLTAEAANRAKSEFLSFMSHELRTPLNAVIGFSETLRLRVFGELNEKQTEYINHIHEGGTLLLKLINDLLHLSKIETGAVELELTQCNLSEIVKDVVPMVEHLLDKNQVQLHEDVITEGISPVIVDKIRMDQVMVNLISNAVKYGHHGGNIWLSVKRMGQKQLRISVRDDGIGIAEEQFENVFTPFNRAGMEQSGIEGTGAGLSIVKALVEAMGGIIDFDSTLGVGTTFWVDLPAVNN